MQRRDVLGSTALASLEALAFTQAVTIEEQAVQYDEESGEAVRLWAPVAGLEELPAAISPFVVGGMSVMEGTSDKGGWANNLWHITLSGYYPAITEMHRIAAAGGRYWDIRGVEHDSHLLTTRLKAEERRL